MANTVDGMEITLADNGVDVVSTSGKTYHVRYAGSGDADPDYVALWNCDCTAATFGRDCKHMRAALASGMLAEVK